jgi:hypothetical protein
MGLINVGHDPIIRSCITNGGLPLCTLTPDSLSAFAQVDLTAVAAWSKASPPRQGWVAQSRHTAVAHDVAAVAVDLVAV